MNRVDPINHSIVAGAAACRAAPGWLAGGQVLVRQPPAAEPVFTWPMPAAATVAGMGQTAGLSTMAPHRVQVRR